MGLENYSPYQSKKLNGMLVIRQKISAMSQRNVDARPQAASRWRIGRIRGKRDDRKIELGQGKGD